MVKDNQYEKFRQTCLLGHIEEALSMTKSKKLGRLTKKQRSIVNAVKKRFSARFPLQRAGRSSIQDLIQAYERYWHQSLLKIKKSQEYEKELIRFIRNWLLTHFKIKSTHKNCYKKLESCLRKKGIHCLIGKVSHLNDLIIWRKEKPRNFKVSLLESTQNVKVVFMDNYVTYGWMDYATCGGSKVGGWAKEKALFCNTTEYDIRSENFKVSYLTHEAQHFADYKRFKNLDSYALEYRAKLAEIISSRKTTKILVERFKAQSSKSRHSYHHYASYKLIHNLGRSIEASPVEIRAKANQLLLEDSQNRKKTGFKSL